MFISKNHREALLLQCNEIQIKKYIERKLLLTTRFVVIPKLQYKDRLELEKTN